MEALYKAYKGNEKVAMYLVYVNETHLAKTNDPKGEGPHGIKPHRNIEGRLQAASKCMEGLKLTVPVLIDRMDAVVEKAYRGSPGATAVIDLEGKVVFHTIGPRGVQPAEADTLLKKLIAKGGFPKPEKKPSRRLPLRTLRSPRLPALPAGRQAAGRLNLFFSVSPLPVRGSPAWRPGVGYGVRGTEFVAVFFENLILVGHLGGRDVYLS